MLRQMVQFAAQRLMEMEAETLASLMLTSEDWIPLDGVHEAPLIRALVAQGRRFVKPLRYDARSAAPFANAILLDAGAEPVALHVLSGFMTAAERDGKERAIRAAGEGAWVWRTEGAMPALPVLLARNPVPIRPG